LRRCVSITLIWVVVWAICAVGLSFRPPYELRYPAAHTATEPPNPVTATP
jgi:hypothetical protein